MRQDGESFSSSHGGDGVEVMPLDMIYVKNEVAVDSHGSGNGGKGGKDHMMYSEV